MVKYRKIILIPIILFIFANTFIMVVAEDNFSLPSMNKTINQLFSSSSVKQPNAIIILNSSNKSSMQESRDYIESLGGKIRHIYPPHILIGYLPEEVSQKITNEKNSSNSQKITGLENIVSISNSEIDSSTLEKYGKTVVYAANAWNKNFMGIGPKYKPIPDPGPIEDYVGLPLDYEESRGSMIIHHSPPSDTETSSFMIRDISVAIIFLESNGSIDTETEDWTTTEENNVISEIQNGLNWWIFKEPYADIAFTYAHTGYSMSTSYEPITHPHTDDNLWVIEAMNYLGYDDGEYKLRVRAYDNDIRDSDRTDWGFTIFVVDSSNDGDGEFSDSDWFAYAWPNGPFAVVTYDNNGYGIEHMDAVIAHETGHIFGAADQYDGADPNCNEDSDCSATFGYLEIENQNCERDACISKENSIMRGGTTPFTNNEIDAYAKGQVGWRDEDSDYIIDSADSDYNPDDDTDGDGWVDYWDKCPAQSGQAGLAWGCPECTDWQQVGGCGNGDCESDEKNYTRTCLGIPESKCEYASSCESGGGVTDCTPSTCSGDYEQQGQVSCEWDGNYWTCERVCRRDAECDSSLSLIYDSGLQSQGIDNQYSGSLSTSSTSASDTDYCYKIMSLNNRQYVSSWGWFDADSTNTEAGVLGPTIDTNLDCYDETGDGQNIYPGIATVCLAPDTPDSWGGLSGCTTYRAGSGYGSGYYSKISFLSYNDAGCGGGFENIDSQTLYTQFKVYRTPFTPEDYDYLYCDVPYTSDIYLDSPIYGDADADCDVEVMGIQSYPEEIKVKWYVNGDYVHSETCDDGECDDDSGSTWSNTFSLSHSYFSKGDEIYCIGRGYGEDGGHGAYDLSSTTTVSNRVPTWSSISLDKSYAKQGDNIKVTASGEDDLDTDSLAMYCCNGASCTPSNSNHDFCYVTGDSSPYNLYCTGQGLSGEGAKTVRCRIYDGDDYSDIKSNTYIADNTAPNLDITSPLNQTYSVSSINFNVSLNENGSCIYSISNGATNISMSSSDNRNFNSTNSSMNNGGYIANFYCNDTLGNKNESESVSFTVDAASPDNSPAVTLTSPLNNSADEDGIVTFNCSATDDYNLKNITIYGNWSGGWHANETKSLTGTSNSTTFTKMLPSGIYKWNCLAFDNSSQSDWADANWTVNITIYINNINSCTTLDSPNSKYTLEANIINNTITNNCIIVNAQNITLDCAGYYISSTQNYSGIYSYSYNTTIKNCNISMGINGKGIYLIGAHNSIINNNILNSQHTGLYLVSTNNTLIENNTANLNADGIYLASGSNNNALTNNLVNLNYQYGIYLVSSSDNNTLTGNTANSNNWHGIILSSSEGNTLTNNTANSDDIGIYLASSSNNNTLTNNTANSNNEGIYLSFSNDSSLISNIANSNEVFGFAFYRSNNNILINNTIWNCSSNETIGACLQVYNSNNNLFDKNSINYTSKAEDYGIWIKNTAESSDITSNNGFKDTDIINIAGTSVFIDGGLGYGSILNNSFINCSYNNESVSSGSQLIRKWYYRAYVNDSSGNTVPDANITAYNVTGNYQFNLTTDESGYTPITEIIDYINNGTNKNYYSNYTLYADNVTLSGSHSYNVTLNQNNLKDVFTLSEDDEIIEITSCQELNEPGTYQLQNDITGITATCFTINANNIILDMNGKNITGNISGNGVYINRSNSSTVKNGYIYDFSNGAYLLSGSYNNLSNNVINSNTNGILLSSASNNNLSNNIINDNSVGIYVSSSSNNWVINNTVNSGGTGMFLSSGSGSNNLINNTVNSNSEGIYLASNSNNNLSNNIANENIIQGIHLLGSSGNRVINNTVNSNGRNGIYLNIAANNNLLANNSIWNCSKAGVYSCINVDESDKNIFDSNAINQSSKYGIWIQSAGNFAPDNSDNNTFMNTNMTNINSTSVFIDDDGSSKNTNNTFINMSYNNETVDSKSQLVRKWYYQSYVNDSSGNAVSGAYVTGFNVSGALQFNLTTSISGWINRTEVIEYVNTGTPKYYSLYTLYADNITLSDSHSYNVTLEKNNLNDVFTLE